MKPNTRSFEKAFNDTRILEWLIEAVNNQNDENHDSELHPGALPRYKKPTREMLERLSTGTKQQLVNAKWEYMRQMDEHNLSDDGRDEIYLEFYGKVTDLTIPFWIVQEPK